MSVLQGRVAVVTGAARGVGLATAETLAGRGAAVALGDPDVELAAEAASRLGGDAVALPLDVRDRASFGGFLDAVEERLGPLEILVNNAATMAVGPFLEEDEATTEAMIDVNLRGVINGCRLAVPRMLDHGRGHVVNIASMAGKAPVPLAATYSATKHGVVGFTDALRAELRGRGVRLSTIMPTVVDARVGGGIGRTIGPLLEPEDVAEAAVHVLETGKREITVPRWVAAISRPAGLLPPGARDWLLRATGESRSRQRAALQARPGYGSDGESG